MEISVVLPCRNESANVGECVQRAFSGIDFAGKSGEVIVVDNSSSDNSVEIAEKAGARVISQPSKGYGATCLAGFSAAKGRIIVVADADNSYDLRELSLLTEALSSADLVVGSRFLGIMEEGAMPLLHEKLGNPLLTAAFNVLFSTRLTDTHSGFRAIRKKSLGELNLSERGFNLTLEMLAKAVQKNFRVREVPISYGQRAGFSKLNSLVHGSGHFAFMLQERFT